MQQKLIKMFAVPTVLLHSEAEHNIYKVRDPKAYLFRSLETTPTKSPLIELFLNKRISDSNFLKFWILFRRKFSWSLVSPCLSIKVSWAQCPILWSANKSKMPGASAAWRADGAGEGGRDLWEGWDEGSLLRGWNLRCEQRWFKVNVVDSRSSTTSHIPLRCVVTQHNMGCGTLTKNTLTKVFVFHMKGCHTHA